MPFIDDASNQFIYEFMRQSHIIILKPLFVSSQNSFYFLVCLVTWYFCISWAVFHSFDILFLSVSMFRYAQTWMLFDIPLVST